jgi:hypothetical protein
MIITWEIDDGYCGAGRPQTTEVPDEDLEGLTEDERERLIEEYVGEDFLQTISWRITHRE